MNISSAIVHARPDSVGAVREAIGALAGAEIHAADDEGRLIITLEAEDDRATADTFDSIGRIAGVLTVAMVYHRTEADPDLPISAQGAMPQLQGGLQ